MTDLLRTREQEMRIRAEEAKIAGRLLDEKPLGGQQLQGPDMAGQGCASERSIGGERISFRAIILQRTYQLRQEADRLQALADALPSRLTPDAEAVLSAALAYYLQFNRF